MLAMYCTASLHTTIPEGEYYKLFCIICQNFQGIAVILQRFYISFKKG